MYVVNRIGSNKDICGTSQLQIVGGDDADPVL